MSAYDPLIRVAVILGYLCGSIPFGLIFTRMAGLGDIRAIGSGNIGATNVLRTGNRWLALATLLADGLKATIPILIARATWGDGAGVAVGLGAFIGHVFPLWLKFKGGKGVATYIGVLLGLYWPAGIAFCLIWLIMAWRFRYSSLSALTAATIVAIGTLSLSITVRTDETAPSAAPNVTLGVVFLVLAALIFFTHRANVQRLIGGTEPKIGAGKTAVPSGS
jgi:glycerol-3-phosphate acyltransferase PlsY